jgi:aspartokinase/homoserine dehydrogenase 1
MAKTIIMKFGGTSVGNADAIKRTAGLIHRYQQEGHRVVVVVSAMRGVTDALITAATRAADGEHGAPLEARQWLWEKHYEAALALLPDSAGGVLGEIEAELSNFANLVTATSVLGEVTPRAMDFISSLGERFNAILVAAYLSAIGCPAQDVMADTIIVTDTHFGNANPNLPATGERCQRVLAPMLEAGVVPVVTGFMGATPAGIVTTLGRGGSDFTASILGHGLNADEIWIWSDVDGVLTADPRIVPDAHPIPVLSYREAAELAHFGAKVLHPKTVRPAVEKGIPIRMLNTFNPDHPGTWIRKGGDESPSVKAVTAIPKLALVTVEGRGMLGVPGVAARVFGAVAQLGVSVLMISQGSSEQSICFVVPQSDAEAVTNALEEAFHLELFQGNIDRVWQDDEVVIVALVGAAMRGTPGIAARLFTALGNAKINVASIAQGSSEYNVSLVVSKEDANPAILAIHQAFNLGNGGS